MLRFTLESCGPDTGVAVSTGTQKPKDFGKDAAPNTLFLTVPKLLCPTPAGCSASGWNGGQRDGGCIAPDTGLLSLKYGGLLRRKEGHFSHVYYSHHFGDSLS